MKLIKRITGVIEEVEDEYTLEEGEELVEKTEEEEKDAVVELTHPAEELVDEPLFVPEE